LLGSESVDDEHQQKPVWLHLFIVELVWQSCKGSAGHHAMLATIMA
jgi:hypothetical protein